MPEWITKICTQYQPPYFTFLMAIVAYSALKFWAALSPSDRKTSNIAGNILDKGWPFRHSEPSVTAGREVSFRRRRARQ